MAHVHHKVTRLMKRVTTLSIVQLFATLAGCGGESQTYFIDSQSLSASDATEQAAASSAEPRTDESSASTFQAASIRAQVVRLQSSLWATACENRQITTLSFTPKQLTTETIFYKDVNCLEVRQEIRRKNIELYRVGAPVVDATGVVAIQIHFETVLSDRYDRFIFENGILYFGQRQGQASYRAEAIDFQIPYFPMHLSDIQS